MATVRELRNKSNAPTTLCKECIKAVKDDEKSGIGCHFCNGSIHGGCLKLSVNNEVFTNNSKIC